MSNEEPERFIAPTAKAAGAPIRIDIERSVATIRAALEGLRFGSILLTVHDARVVQIDVTEKTRFNA
ncbi:DUF2292 domain-containing protein [Sphingobium algorifonticola]|uniref:DUF2292 domain-containing protein n=2 Tax=Sphingobium algorifonticola TaxID=2008318 RepID=A0A437JEA5_9SPHN|nr:DUF2292 domain-containing protein [Sphingobium algorifonticola]